MHGEEENHRRCRLNAPHYFSDGTLAFIEEMLTVSHSEQVKFIMQVFKPFVQVEKCWIKVLCLTHVNFDDWPLQLFQMTSQPEVIFRL